MYIPSVVFTFYMKIKKSLSLQIRERSFVVDLTGITLVVETSFNQKILTTKVWFSNTFQKKNSFPETRKFERE